MLYELADASATESPEYLELRRWEASQADESFEAPATSRPGFERGIYDQTGGPFWPGHNLIAPLAHVAGFQSSQSIEDEFREWLAVHTTRLRAIPGVTAVRSFRLTGHSFGDGAIRTQMHTPHPRIMTISYLADASGNARGGLPGGAGGCRTP